MPATPLDSATYSSLLGDAELARLFTDAAEIRAMLLVEGALARAQGEAGTIPETAARAIHRASLEVWIDPAELADGVGQSAVPVPALASAFRAQLPPEHAAFVHWGATSQDIVDTALVLRLRQAAGIMEDRLIKLAKTLGELAEAHADLPMAARTYGQVAVPTSFGAVVASWASPLLVHLERLAALRPRLLRVSLSGAAGTSSALGSSASEVRWLVAQGLDLADPGGTWHTDRSPMADLAGWLTLVTGSLGKMGLDLTLMTRSGDAVVRLGSSGGSSTMPQKTNPVLPSLLVAIARQVASLNAGMQAAVVHAEQRDATAWFVEWMSLPQMVLLTGRALTAGAQAIEGLTPDADAMAQQMQSSGGVIFAEALSFALSATMPRPEAQVAVKRLCEEAAATGSRLEDLAVRSHPDGDLAKVFDPREMLGCAPEEARALAAAARDLRQAG
jgi:3-carboxy-cis,cis-muconate cycloisomerase